MTYIAKYAHFQKKKIKKKIEAAIRHFFWRNLVKTGRRKINFTGQQVGGNRATTATTERSAAAAAKHAVESLNKRCDRIRVGVGVGVVRKNKRPCLFVGTSAASTGLAEAWSPAHRNRGENESREGEEHESASQQSTHPTGDGWMDSDRVWARLPSDPLGGTVCVLYHEYSCTTEQMFLVFVCV